MFDRLKRPGETDSDSQSSLGLTAPTLQLSRETVELAGSPTLHNFALDSAALTKEHRDQLKSLVRFIQSVRAQHPGVLVLTGHTDATGSEQHNENLGQRRAEAVKMELLLLGLPASMLLVSPSPGEGQLLIDTQEAEPLNRRVEVQYRTAQPSLPNLFPPPVPDITPKLPPFGGKVPPPLVGPVPPPAKAEDKDSPIEVTTNLALKFKDGEIYHIVNVEVTIELVKPHDVSIGKAFKVSFGQLDLKASLEMTAKAGGGKVKIKEVAGEFGTDFTIVSIKANRPLGLIPKGTKLELSLNVGTDPATLAVQGELEGKLQVPITDRLGFGAKTDGDSVKVFIEWRF